MGNTSPISGQPGPNEYIRVDKKNSGIRTLTKTSSKKEGSSLNKITKCVSAWVKNTHSVNQDEIGIVKAVKSQIEMKLQRIESSKVEKIFYSFCECLGFSTQRSRMKEFMS